MQREDSSGINWWKGWGCGMRPKYSFSSIPPRRARHGLSNCCSGSRRKNRIDSFELREHPMVGEVIKKIGEPEFFVLTSHARPDGDAIGSGLACFQILQALGKRAQTLWRDAVALLYRR